MTETVPLTTQTLVWAYRHGVFPMARHRDGPIDWYCPDPRAVLPLDRFHVPRSLQRRVRGGEYRITFDRAFTPVMRACAQPRAQGDETWINDAIIRVYSQLHQAGLAHSVEAWRCGSADELVGGLYGVSLGGAFFGESMFHRATDASKVCLVHLVEHLRRQEYALLDVQYDNPHLRQFGIEQVPRARYMRMLGEALTRSVGWGGET